MAPPRDEDGPGPRVVVLKPPKEKPHDPPLLPAADDGDLVRPHEIRDLARNRDARRRGDGAVGANPRRNVEGSARARRLRHRAHRRDRARGEARRHRVPDQRRRACGGGSALHAPGHDLVRRARHLPCGAAHARRRHSARRYRRAARRAEAPRAGAQRHAHGGPQPRHPRRADHLRAEARLRLCRVRARQGAASAREGRCRHVRDLRRRRHLRPSRSARGGLRRRKSSASSRSPSRRR